MANRQLTNEELIVAHSILDEIRAKLHQLAGDDRELLFAYLRKIYKELGCDERSKPAVRRALKERKWKEQRGLCSICSNELPTTYTVLGSL